MRYTLAIFDLDGTILNTLEDLACAVNAALAKNGFPTHTIEDVRIFVGNGVANLIRRAVPEGTDEETINRVLADFKAYYKAHINDHTRPYAGVIDLLKRLKAAGMKVGVNSNKYDAALQDLCHIHFEGLYDCAVGESEITPKKPDPTAARRIMAAVGADALKSIYIGDSDVDIRTGNNAGMDTAWVSWGFRRRAEMANLSIPLTFDTPEALADYLLK